ncbi:MAG: transposase [Solirubrobacteraceae bacterium]
MPPLLLVPSASGRPLRRGLIASGLAARMLIIADGAFGLIKAIEQCWMASDRQRCCVHGVGPPSLVLPGLRKPSPSP